MKKILRLLKKKCYGLLFRAIYFLATKKAALKIEELPCDKVFRLNVPTYDGSGQAVHPSILRRSGVPKFAMAFTPYTDTIDKVENPSFVVSDDGLNFYEEQKGLNPLVPAPQVDHNDDPELFFSGGKYGILYLETMRPEVQNLILLESRDRISWKKRLLYSERLGGDCRCFMLSPKYLELDGKACIFYVNRDCPGGYKIEFVHGDSLESLNYKKPVQLSIPDVGGYPWHLDIIADKSCYYMLLAVAKNLERGSYYSLQILRSKNLLDWQLCSNFKMKSCYKSSGYVEDGVFYIYMSKIFLPHVRRKKWKIVLIKKKIDQLIWR